MDMEYWSAKNGCQQLLVEPINFDQAKEVVSSYMRDHRTASISELAEQLQIDLRMLCKVIEELSKEEFERFHGPNRISTRGRHNAQRIKAEGNPAFAVIDKQLDWVD